MELSMPFLLLGLYCSSWVGPGQFIVAEVKLHTQAPNSSAIVDLACRVTFLLLCFCLLLASSSEAFYALILLSTAISPYHSMLIRLAKMRSRALRPPVFFRHRVPGTWGVASLVLLLRCGWSSRPSTRLSLLRGGFCLLPVEWVLGTLPSNFGLLCGRRQRKVTFSLIVVVVSF